MKQDWFHKKLGLTRKMADLADPRDTIEPQTGGDTDKRLVQARPRLAAVTTKG